MEFYELIWMDRVHPPRMQPTHPECNPPTQTAISYRNLLKPQTRNSPWSFLIYIFWKFMNLEAGASKMHISQWKYVIFWSYIMWKLNPRMHVGLMAVCILKLQTGRRLPKHYVQSMSRMHLSAAKLQTRRRLPKTPTQNANTPTQTASTRQRA